MEINCKTCVHDTRYGCRVCDCEYVDRNEAIQAWKEKQEELKKKQVIDELQNGRYEQGVRTYESEIAIEDDRTDCAWK